MGGGDLGGDSVGPGRDKECCASPRPRGEGPGCARELRVTRGHRALPCTGSWGLDSVPTGAGGQGEGRAAGRRRRAGPGGAASRGLLLLFTLFGLSSRAAGPLRPPGARGDVHPRREPTEQEAAAVW